MEFHGAGEALWRILRRPTGSVLLLWAALPLVLFLTAPFHLDDIVHVVQTERLADWRRAWPGSWKEYFVRGVTGLTFALQRAVWGTESAFSYRAANLILHAANGWLVHRLFLRLLVGARAAPARPVAALAALLFLVHPLQTGSVTYVSGRHGLLSAALMLVALHAYLDLRARGKGLARFAACAFLALGAKEDAVALPLFMALAEAFLPRRGVRAAALSGAGRPRFPAAAWACAAALLLFFLWARFGDVLDAAGRPQGRDWIVTEGERMYGRWVYFRTQCVVIPGDYLRKWFLPAGFSMDLDPPIRWRWDAASLGGAAFLAAASAWALRRVGGGPAALGWLWGLAALAPSSSVQPLEEPAAERRVYLAAAGWALLAAWFLARAARRLGRSGRTLLWAGGAILLAGAACRNADYQSARTLWRKAVLAAPRKARPYLALGATVEQEAHRKPARAARAARLFAAAYRAQPEDGRSAYFLGNLALASGNAAEAEAWFARALVTKRDHPPFLAAHAEAAARRGDWAAARERYREAARLAPGVPAFAARAADAERRLSDERAALAAAVAADPDDRTAVRAWGLFCQRAGDLAAAREAFSVLVAKDPSDLSAWNSLASVLFEEGRTAADPAERERILSAAADAIGRSLTLSPEDPFLHAFRGQVASARRAWDEAVSAYREALRLSPVQSSWWTALGFALSGDGRSEEARVAWREALRLNPADLSARNALERSGTGGR